MNKRVALPLIWFVVLCLTSCSSIRLQQDPPKVHLDSLYLLPSEGLTQKFKLGLRVMNSNKTPIAIEGVYIELALNGYDLLQGGTPTPLQVNGYSEGRLEVDVSTNLLSALRFINGWLNEPGQTTLQYGLKAKLDIKGSLLDTVVRQSGEVDLQNLPGA